jgi:hypothetical protein
VVVVDINDKGIENDVNKGYEWCIGVVSSFLSFFSRILNGVVSSEIVRC